MPDFEPTSEPPVPEIDLKIIVQPAQNNKTGKALYPPIAVRLSSDDTKLNLALFSVAITMVDSDGNVVEQYLKGKADDSLHPIAEDELDDTQRAYCYFHPLAIEKPGQYRIRVTPMTISYGPVMYEHKDTHVITIGEAEPYQCRLSDDERKFLQIIDDDGYRVPSELLALFKPEA